MFDDYQTKSMIKLVRLFTLLTALANAQHEYHSKYEVKSERRNLQDGSARSGGWQQRQMRSRERHPDPTKPNNEGIEIDMNLIALPPGLVTVDGGRDGYEGGEYTRLSSNKAPEVTSRIINGDRAPQHRYPWMVSIFDRKEDGSLIYKCGGSLVAPNIVMSAAHCHKIAKVVQIGRRDLYDPTEEYEEYKITQIITHPQYDEKLFLSDVMLLVFDGISKHEPILLNHPGSSFVVEKGQSLTVTGWGSTQTSYHGGSRRNLLDAGSTTLLEVVIEAWSFEECLETYNTPNKLGNYTICANKDSDPLKDNSFNDACQGDSGGPLIIRRSARSVSDDNGLQQSQLRDVQVGIVSWGAGCGDPKYPGVYARVSHLYLWINEKICEHSPARCDKTAAIVVNTDNKPDQDEEDNVITECLDEEMFVYYNPKKDKRKTFTCEYVREDKGRRCKDYGEFCPVSCGLCGKM